MSGRDEKQLRVRVPSDTYMQLEYWASKQDVSINEFVRDSIAHYVAWLNSDFQIPTLEQQRFNQILEHIDSLAISVRNEQQMIASGFNSLLGLTRGDSYLLEEDDGEL